MCLCYYPRGDAVSRAKRVAPGYKTIIEESTEGAKYRRHYSALSELRCVYVIYPGATRFAPLTAGYYIPRLRRSNTFGAMKREFRPGSKPTSIADLFVRRSRGRDRGPLVRRQ